MLIPKKDRDKLKKPLGKLYSSLEMVKTLSKKYKIVSVGDICTLALLCIGVRPHLAVYDFKYMRKDLPEGMRAILQREFKNVKSIKNAAGTVSKKLLTDAKKMMKEGGAIRINGEEDLTALAFIKHAGDDTVVVYGQPEKGIVIVTPNKKTKQVVSKII